MANQNSLPPDVKVIPDDLCDRWEAAKIAFGAARAELRAADNRMAATMGTASIGIRASDSRVIVKVEETPSGGCWVPARIRRDRRLVSENRGRN